MSAKSARKLLVNPIACSGHGVCAELLPELITLDEWGYPLLASEPVPDRLLKRARRTVTDCPALALQLTSHSALRPPGHVGNNDEHA
jgi:ferredoxin